MVEYRYVFPVDNLIADFMTEFLKEIYIGTVVVVIVDDKVDWEATLIQ